MALLRVILIDVGWGDSILIESEDDQGVVHRGLIDSNDTTYQKSSYLFLKRHFEKAGINVEDDKPIFEFVMLSHPHSDHAQGLKAIMKSFGTRYFWYPKSLEWANCSYLISYARRSTNVRWYQAVDDQHILNNLGNASLRILWPPQGIINAHSENNNSIVLQLTLDQMSVLLTGDAEADVWQGIAGSIPANTAFFKVPHHGSVNGTFDNDQPAWLNDCPQGATLGISSHVRPFNHPHQRVINLFAQNNRTFLRTDEHYHLTFTTDGHTPPTLKYSH
jgi:beta-lactamase superfamily II metal-dependent hydrolase